MAAGNRSGGHQAKFANIKKGKIHVYQGKNQPDLVYSYIEGNLTNLAIEQDTYKDDTFDVLKLTIDDGNEAYLLKFRFDSAYSRAFCCTIPNADLNKQITIEPTYDEANKKAGMFVSQDGKALKWCFTRNNPNGMPDLKKAIFKGKEQFDNTDQLAFFKDLLFTKIKPQLKHAALAGPDPEPEPRRQYTGNTDATEITEALDDLPF
jgi:hypothetical protein